MRSFFTAVGNTLQPVGKDTLLPDGRVIFVPRRGPNSTLPDDGLRRYITPRQRVLLGWAKAPFFLGIPLVFLVAYLRYGSQGNRVPIDFARPGEALFVALFATVWLLAALGFLAIYRIGSRVEEQFYEPGD
jgi:hypothetical protein